MHNFEWFFGIAAATLCNTPFSRHTIPTPTAAHYDNKNAERHGDMARGRGWAADLRGKFESTVHPRSKPTTTIKTLLSGRQRKTGILPGWAKGVHGGGNGGPQNRYNER